MKVRPQVAQVAVAGWGKVIVVAVILGVPWVKVQERKDPPAWNRRVQVTAETERTAEAQTAWKGQTRMKPA